MQAIYICNINPRRGVVKPAVTLCLIQCLMYIKSPLINQIKKRRKRKRYIFHIKFKTEKKVRENTRGRVSSSGCFPLKQEKMLPIEILKTIIQNQYKHNCGIFPRYCFFSKEQDCFLHGVVFSSAVYMLSTTRLYAFYTLELRSIYFWIVSF